MPIDLSYVNRPAPPRLVFALEPRGWSVAWAVAKDGALAASAIIQGVDHIEGKPVAATFRAMGIFQGLLKAGQPQGVGKGSLVVVDKRHGEAALWFIAGLVAVTLRTRYAEMGDWLKDIGMEEGDMKSLGHWAALQIGKPPANEQVARAVGMALAGSKVI